MYYGTFDLALWLYAVKYWTTSYVMELQVNPNKKTSKSLEISTKCVAYSGVIVIIALAVAVSSLEFSWHLNSDPKIIKYYDWMLLLLILTRFVSFGLLVNAMARIKRIFSKDQLKMPNNRMMLLHLFAFAGFLLANIPYGVTVAK